MPLGTPLGTPTLQDVVQHPEFFTLPEPQQLDLMREVSIDFAGLPPHAQRQILQDTRRQYAPTTGERVQSGLEIGLPAIGAGVGGTAGAAGGPGPAILGAVAGGSLGTSLTEFTRPLLTDQPMRSPEAMATRQAETIGGAAVGEFGGQALVGTAGRVLAPFARTVSPEARVAQAALARVGQRLSPAQMTDSRVLDMIESAAEASFTGGGRLTAMKKEAAEAGVRALTDDVVQRVGTQLGPTDLARLLHSSRDMAVESFDAAKRVLYREVDELARGTIVDTSSAMARVRGTQVNRFTDRALASADAGMDLKIVDLLQRPHVRVGPGGRTITSLSDTAPFSAVQEARSRLLRVGRRFEQAVTVDDEAIGKEAKRLAGLLDRALDDAGQRLNPEALAKFREANQFTAEGIERLHGHLVRRVVRTLEREPGKLDAVLFQPGTVDTWKAFRKALDPGTMERLEQRMAVRLIQDSTDATTGVVHGATLLTKLRGLGAETTTAMLPRTATAIEDLARVAHTVQMKSPTTTGRVFMQLSQASSAFQVVAQPFSGRGTTGLAWAVILGPIPLGRILTSETGIRWLTTGLKAGPGTETFLRMMAQLAAQYGTRGALPDRATIGAPASRGVLPTIGTLTP